MERSRIIGWQGDVESMTKGLKLDAAGERAIACFPSKALCWLVC
jgi:hypothetical protein